MTNYESGRSFEYRVKRVLEDNGYYVVRSASSQGVFDLATVGNDKLHGDGSGIGIQCKHNCSLSLEESMNLLLCRLVFGVDTFLAWSEKGGPIRIFQVTFDGLIETNCKPESYAVQKRYDTWK